MIDTPGPQPVRVVLNGQEREVPGGQVLAELVAGLAPGASGIAVAVNDEVVARARWVATALHPGDRVEVLTAVQGG
ncbi:MAG: sulfur carrier protein ThiS [Actinomycetes bacterium]